MLRLIWDSFRRRMRQNKAMIAMLLCGLVISSFCISVMLGLAVGQYHLSTGGNIYATLTIEPGEEAAQNIAQVAQHADSIADAGVANMLCMTQLSDNHILIGWQGTGGDYWFPITSGSFFSELDHRSNAQVAFISDSYQKDHMNEHEARIGNHAYSIIGSGWIVPYNFTAALSSKSDTQIFPDVEGDGFVEPYFTIIPFAYYAEEFEPALILLHFNTATYSQLESYANALSAKFPDSHIYLPDRNSDNLLTENQIMYGRLGMLLCAIASITIILLMSEWMALYRKELYVYHLCGMTNVKCFILIYSHWFVLVSIGAVIAVAAHYWAFPMLQYVNADYPPQIGIFAFSLLLFYISTVACSVRTAAKQVKSGWKGVVT